MRDPYPDPEPRVLNGGVTFSRGWADVAAACCGQRARASSAKAAETDGIHVEGQCTALDPIRVAGACKTQ